MQKLERLVHTLENKISYLETLNPEVSKGSVGWHIEHVLLTINEIVKAIERSNPKEYKAKFSLAKLWIFSLKKIPMGRIRAPESVRPADNFTNESIKKHFAITYNSISQLDHLEKNNFFTHPFFGHLNIKSSRKFIHIHTNHHLNIIDKILMAENKKA